MRIAILTRVRPDPQGDADERRCHAALSEVTALGHDLLILSRWTGRPIDDPQLGRRARIIYPFRRFAAWEWPRAWAALYEFDPEVLHCLLDQDAAWWSAEQVAPSSADFVSFVREQMSRGGRLATSQDFADARVPALMSLGPKLADSPPLGSNAKRPWPKRSAPWISRGYQGVETAWLTRAQLGAPLQQIYASALSTDSTSPDRDAGTMVTLHFLTTPSELLSLIVKRDLDHALGPLAGHPEVHFACSLHRREFLGSTRNRWEFWEPQLDLNQNPLGARMHLSALENTSNSWRHYFYLLASDAPLTESTELRARHVRILKDATMVWTPTSAADRVRRELRRAGLLAQVNTLADLDWPHGLYLETQREEFASRSMTAPTREADRDLGGNRISRLYAWLAHPETLRPSQS